MARLQLFEFHDQPWFPAAWRDLLTQLMQGFAERFHPFRPVAPKLRAALARCGSDTIIDLGSGSAGPVVALTDSPAIDGNPSFSVILTDKYPNLAAFRHAAAASGGRIRFVAEPVDATSPPSDLTGFRTLFNAFHHFPPSAARAILQNAVDRGSGIGVFEYTERSWVWFLSILFLPLFLWLTAPFVLHPFGWRQVLWIYLLPVPVIAVMWDGFVSCLRTYSPAELRHLTDGLTGRGFDWEIGREHSFGACRITYLIGTPRVAGPKESR